MPPTCVRVPVGPSHSSDRQQGTPQDAEQANHVPERSLAAFTKAHFWEPLKKLEVSQENERLQKLEVERQQQLLRRKDPFHFVRRPSDQNASRFSSFKDLDNHIQMRWDEYNEAQRKLSEVYPTSFEEAAALGHNCAKCWLDMVIRDHAASVIQAFWRRKTGRPFSNSGNSNRLGKRMFRKSTSVKEARLLGSKPKTAEQQTGTRKRDMRRSATVTLDGRPSPPSPTLQHQGLIDRHTQRKALLDDRSSPESPQLATSDRDTPPSPQGFKRDAPADHRASVDHRAEGKKGASGQGMPFARQMGRREDAEILAPEPPQKASEAAHPSTELRSSVLQQMIRSMHVDKASLLKNGEPPMSGPSSISEDAPSMSPANPLASQQRAPRTSGSRLEDLLFSSGLCTSQQQHQGHSRSDSTKVNDLLLDGRPTYTRLSCDQGRRSRRSSLMAAHTSASGPLTFVSGSNSNNNSSSIGPSNPHNSRSSILNHNHLPQMESDSSSSSSSSNRPRRHSLTTNLVLSKSSCLPARTSTASGRLSTPAGAIMGRSASFTSNLQPQPPSGGHGNNAGREAPLLNTRGSGGLKPTGTRPSADGVMPSRLGLLSSTLHGSS